MTLIISEADCSVTLPFSLLLPPSLPLKHSFPSTLTRVFEPERTRARRLRQRAHVRHLKFSLRRLQIIYFPS